MSPCKSAVTDRVIPQPGQYIPKMLYVKHVGSVKCSTIKTAAKYKTAAIKKGDAHIKIF